MQATIAGKPEPLMFEVVRSDFDSGARLVMIGDNPDTDILGAHRAGIASILMTHSAGRSADAAPHPAPDLILSTLTTLFDDDYSMDG